MEANTSIFKKRKTSSLFIPRASVIRHTSDVKLKYLSTEPESMLSTEKQQTHSLLSPNSEASLLCRITKRNDMDVYNNNNDDSQCIDNSDNRHADKVFSFTGSSEIKYKMSLLSKHSSSTRNSFEQCYKDYLIGTTAGLQNVCSEYEIQYLKNFYRGVTPKALREAVNQVNKSKHSYKSRDKLRKRPHVNHTTSIQNLQRESSNNGFATMTSESDFSMSDDPSRGFSAPMRKRAMNSCKNILNLQCEYCYKQFTNEDASRRHMLTHKGKRTYKCEYCARSFYDQSSHIRHLKSHNGDKAHKCKKCLMAFNKRSALEVHFRTHTGERPFVCKYCDKGFSISGNLHRHMLIHTGHRPYQCGKCTRAFNNPSHLARHISSFHM